MTPKEPKSLEVESAVRDRYAAGARAQEAALCCPVDYDPKFLAAIPQEVIDKDYGCGDPTRYLQPGETVLDLGSGTGKICFIAAQVVGPRGRVLGVDMTEDMLEVARRNAPTVATNIGYSNVEFLRGRIQDLSLDLDRLDTELSAAPISSARDLFKVQNRADQLRKSQPLIANESIDVVVSNCVLNLVAQEDKQSLFAEIFRVLRNGGRAVISDIVADEPVPQDMQDDAALWSGCISGALTETNLLRAFEDAGFHGIRLLEREQEPWQTVRGIEFRSVVVEAFRGKAGPCLERNQAVIYKGPFKEVLDDDGHRLVRGERQAVCDKTYNLYRAEPYQGLFEFVDPREAIALKEAKPFDCSRDAVRPARESKGMEYAATIAGGDCCSNSGCC